MQGIKRNGLLCSASTKQRDGTHIPIRIFAREKPKFSDARAGEIEMINSVYGSSK